MKPTLNVLIVDDEKKACINLRNLIEKYVPHGVNVIGMANSTAEAEILINIMNQHAVFIDIDMPGENAFQFFQRILPFTFEVVFVTAYDQYAVKAFRLNAVDYILKPIDIDELVIAFDKLYERLNFKRIFKEDHTTYSDLLHQVQHKPAICKIMLKSVNASELVAFADIYFVEAQGSYSRIVFLKENKICEMIMSHPLSEYEELLPADMYYRVHKSYIINCMHVEKIITDDNIHVILKDKFTIPVSRRRIISMKKFLKANGYLL